MSAPGAGLDAVGAPAADDRPPSDPGARPFDPTGEHPTGRQGRYAGIVSRAVSTIIDAVVLSILSFGTLLVLQAVIAMIQGEPFSDVNIDSSWGLLIVGFQAMAYFTIGWAVFGRSGGEALLGLRVVRRNGSDVGWGRAFLRFLVWPFAYSFCGLGFFWILIDNRRRTWPDLIVGTVVVYDWRRADRRPVETIEPHR
jgi:uncharacterized RDD family membrane protein YckC